MAEAVARNAAFEPVTTVRDVQAIARPSLSYWQDAWIRLRKNRRAFVSLYIVAGLLVFTIAGPWIWTADPAQQDLDQLSHRPGATRAAVIAEPFVPWPGVVATLPAEPGELRPVASIGVSGQANTQAVRLYWDPVAAASGYRVYRSILDPGEDRALGLPLAETFQPQDVSFEDRLDLEGRRYWYSVVVLRPDGEELEQVTTLAVDVTRVITAQQAADRGLVGAASELKPGDKVLLPLHPLGTDYLGRDMLARLMHGARVSLFIGIVAPFFYVALGILYGSAAGFVGGRLDQVLMRFADFVVALPFLLFMILLRIAFGIRSGESGIGPLLVALVLLAWPGTARLVRGQILQIRQEGYIGAARLLGARTSYLVLRHMIPNTMGVILVTLT